MKNKLAMLTLVGIMGTTSVAFGNNIKGNAELFISGVTKLEYDMVEKMENEVFKVQIPEMYEENVEVTEDATSKNRVVITYEDGMQRIDIVTVYPVKKGLLSGVKDGVKFAEDASYDYYVIYEEVIDSKESIVELVVYLEEKLNEVIVPKNLVEEETKEKEEKEKEEKVIDGVTRYMMVKQYENDLYEIQIPNIIEDVIVVKVSDTSENRVEISYIAKETPVLAIYPPMEVKGTQIVTVYPVKKGLTSGVRGAAIVAQSKTHDFYALISEANMADDNYQVVLKYFKENMSEVVVPKGDNNDTGLIFIPGKTRKYFLTEEMISMEDAKLIDNKTYLPLRKTLEKLGHKVDWNAERKQVTMNFEDNTVKLLVNNDNSTLINGKRYNLTSNVILIDGNSYVTLDLLNEATDLLK